MARKKKSMPGINSSSTADIAFMLLIFFLTTTSMDTDKGLARRLPAPPDPNVKQDDNLKVKERNVLQVRINKDNQLMVASSLTVICRRYFSVLSWHMRSGMPFFI